MGPKLSCLKQLRGAQVQGALEGGLASRRQSMLWLRLACAGLPRPGRHTRTLPLGRALCRPQPAAVQQC